MQSGIYKITNSATGMYYIGSAVKILNRWKNHKIELRLNRHCNPYLQSAWNKYGSFNFAFTVIEYCEREKLIEREQHWIDHYKAANRILGYNLQPIAGSNLGTKASDETRALLSEMKKGRPIHTKESKAKIGEASSKRVFSAESREKMRQSQLGKKQSEKTKEKHRQRMLGNKHSQGSIRTPEHMAALLNARHPKKPIDLPTNKWSSSWD